MVSRFEVWTATATILYSVSTIVTLLRIAHRRGRASLKASDYLALSAWFASTCFTGSVLFGAYVNFLEPRSFGAATHALTDMFFALSLTLVVPLTKISIVLLFLELTPSRWHERTLYTLLALLVASLLSLLAATLFGCYVTPFGRVWSILDTAAVRNKYESSRMANEAALLTHKCIPQTNVILANSFINVIFEFAIFILALPFVWRLRTSLSQKFGLLAAFALGFFTIAASIIFSVLSSKGYWLLLEGHPNVMYYYTGGLWGMAEVNAGLAFASLLPLRGLLVKFMSKHFVRLGVITRLSANIGSSTGMDYEEQVKWPMKKEQFPDMNHDVLRTGLSVITFSTKQISTPECSPLASVDSFMHEDLVASLGKETDSAEYGSSHVPQTEVEHDTKSNHALEVLEITPEEEITASGPTTSDPVGDLEGQRYDTQKSREGRQWRTSNGQPSQFWI